MVRLALTVRQASNRFYLPSAPDLASRTVQKLRHQWNCWERHTANPVIDLVTTGTFVRFRTSALAVPLSPATIEAVVGDVLTVLRCCRAAGVLAAVPLAGRRLKRSQPVPIQPDLSALGDMYRNCRVAKWPILRHCSCQDFWRAWLIASYTLGLRLGDLMFRLTWNAVNCDSVTIRAGKTGKLHILPLHPVLKRHLNLIHDNGGSGDGRVFPVSKSPHLVRRELRRISQAAGVPKVTPQQLRRLAGTQYERAHGGAGPLLLGHTLAGASAFYIDVPSVLRAASDRLEIPQEWLTKADRDSAARMESRLLRAWRVLRLPDREAVLHLAENLA